MDAQNVLKVCSRQKCATKMLRKKGKIPAELYGKGIKNMSLEVDSTEFTKMYQKAGESTLIDLIIDANTPIKALIKDIQKDFVDDNIIHADFYQVNMENKINAQINLVYTGISPAVKTLNAIFVKNHQTIEVRCLPIDLIKEISVDISTLKNFNDSLCAKDIKLPPKMELLSDANIIIAQVTPPRSEEELKSLDEKVNENVDKVENAIKKDKPEEVEGAEPEKKSDIKK